MRNLKQLEKRSKEATARRGDFLILWQDLEDPDIYRTADGVIFDGDDQGRQVIRVEYENDWRGPEEGT